MNTSTIGESSLHTYKIFILIIKIVRGFKFTGYNQPAMPRQCEHAGCRKRPTYNSEGETRGRFCGEHKEPQMALVTNRRCEYAGCRKQPIFNNEGETRGRFCGDHKEHQMLNVNAKKCEHEGCRKQSTYNNEGEKRGRFCGDHKEIQMVLVNAKKCEHAGCRTIAGYGVPGHRTSRCAQHVEVGMIAKPRRLCVETQCREPAIYGINRAVHCVIHRLREEQSLVGGRCASCNLVDILDRSGLCTSCDPNAFQRARLAKQREVKLWLDNSDHGDYVIYDRMVDGGVCEKERPDLAWDCGTHWIVLEVDERQHEDRQEICECTRMVNVCQSFGMPTVFIRYNPDAFKANGRKQNPGLVTRRSTLLKWLQYLKSTPPKHFLSVLHVYYDNYDQATQGVTVLPTL